MTKIETIWCQLLFDVFERRETHFKQQDLARNLSMSTSTVNHALRDLRRTGAVHVGGDGGTATDAEKILIHWASHRTLEKDMVSTIALAESVREVEGSLPPGSILGGYSAVRHWYGEAPADYTTVHVYHRDPSLVTARLTNAPYGNTKLVVLQLPPLIPTRPETTSLAHTFVDLWNVTDWMAKDFVRRVKEDIDGLLQG